MINCGSGESRTRRTIIAQQAGYSLMGNWETHGMDVELIFFPFVFYLLFCKGAVSLVWDVYYVFFLFLLGCISSYGQLKLLRGGFHNLHFFFILIVSRLATAYRHLNRARGGSSESRNKVRRGTP